MANKITASNEVNAPITRQDARDMINEEIVRANQGIREDFIVIFGIFASVLIFLGIEIQVFKLSTRFSLLIGFSLFLLGAMLAFVLGIFSVVREKITYQNLKDNVLIHFILACFVAAAACFAWATIIRPV